MSDLKKIGIVDDTFRFTTVEQLVAEGVLYRPMDGNHGEQHPKVADYVSEGIPFIMANDLVQGRINYDSCSFITKKQADGLRKGFAKSGDVLVTHKATIGRTALVGDEANPYIMLTPQVTYYRIKNPEVVDKRYLRHYFDSSLFQQTLSMWAGGGATRAYLGITGQGKLPVVVPPKNKQRKIAAILTAYDDLIEINKRRIALLEKMAEELYREWFVRLRFPGHQNTRFVKGVPEGWAMQKIEDAFDFTGGGTPSKAVPSYWTDGTVNWFTPSDITGSSGIFLPDSEDRCSEEGLARSSARLFPSYSVMMTSRATIGAIGINTTPACTNQGFITCIPNEKYPLPYLYQWLKSAKPYFEQLCGGATFPELTKGTFKKLEILSPSEEIVKEFTERSAPILKSIENMLEQDKNLTNTRDLLLPRLISGKLSVEDLDIQFPPSMQQDEGAAPVEEDALSGAHHA
ncbi:restriction endonuclease subunit S [Marinimicrobium alkaliphilum]|uniref:restriction endonuclease subunit S n=1 Tax=Marinimicrobium alkaliphilum TaxID=2202654 RepID=UPI0013006C5B|nr:restriction endonuclease subunit S [Marinimicrobium alkaliphilum]